MAFGVRVSDSGWCLLQITGLCVAVGEEVQGVEEAVGELAMLQLKQDPGSVGKEGDMGKEGTSEH